MHVSAVDLFYGSGGLTNSL